MAEFRPLIQSVAPLEQTGLSVDWTEQMAAEAASPAPFEVLTSRGFPDWLANQSLSLAFTTYQSNRLCLVGTKTDGQLSVFQRIFPRCMGLWSQGETLWLSSLYQVWRLENVLRHGPDDKGFDRLYVPRVGYVTGDIDIHDLVVTATGEVVFINTLFGCLATLSETDSFVPLWQPPFLSKLAPEDRCHLNGLALRDGIPRYASACSQADVADGWRESRRDGGVIMDITTNAVIARGLAMPHSPRWYRDRLWILNSGIGQFGWIDVDTGQFEAVAFCPGYARGLAFFDRFAVIGLSHSRHEKTFSGLQLDDELTTRSAEARCGLIVVDLDNGDIVHWLRLEGQVVELYDVVVMPGVKRAKALGFQTDEIRHTVTAQIDGRTRSWSAHSQ